MSSNENEMGLKEIEIAADGIRQLLNLEDMMLFAQKD